MTAAGNYDSTNGDIPIVRTLLEHWDGTAWTRIPSPNANASDNILNGAAASPGGAFAVGFHLRQTGPDQTLILHQTN